MLPVNAEHMTISNLGCDLSHFFGVLSSLANCVEDPALSLPHTLAVFFFGSNFTGYFDISVAACL